MFLLAELCFYWLKGSLVWLVKNSRRLELDRTLACTEGRESDDDDDEDHENHLHNIGDNDHAGVFMGIVIQNSCLAIMMILLNNDHNNDDIK